MTGASSEWSASWLALSQRGVRWSVLCAALMALWGLGCSGGDGFPPPSGVGGGGSSGTGSIATTGSGPASDPACPVEGETRPCHATIGQVENLVNCYEGIETCYHGLWSTCTAETYSLRQLPARLVIGTSQPLESSDTLPDPGGVPGGGALAQPLNATEQMCAGDPCDPTCRSFMETGFTLGVGMMGTSLQWAVATLSSSTGVAATALVSKGLTKSGCTTGADCQNTQYCSYPVTNAACAHDRCAPGSALNPTCDTCVASVCAQNPDCCPYAGTCAHAPCFPGAALACNDPAMPAQYDACVDYVCSDTSTAYCCNTMAPSAATGWDAACVAAYSACQPNPCPLSPGTAWSSPSTYPGPTANACTQLAHDLCGLTCPVPPATCTHDPCITGVALVNAPGSCDTGAATGCVASVCTLQPSCCNQVSGAWDASCVALIPVACGRSCPLAGVCTPILQNQVDVDCNAPDLTASIPCLDKGGSVPPTCNIDADCGNAASGLVCNSQKRCQNGCRGASFGNTCVAGQSCSTSGIGPGSCTGCNMANETTRCPGAGRVCGTTPANQCAFGCRGVGGNGCPAGSMCDSTTTAQGQCISYRVPDPANPGQYMTAPGNYVPVCNFGKVATPMGAKVYLNVYGPGTGGIPNQPAGNNANVKGTCFTTQQILPGKCVDVPCNTTVTGDSGEVYVNPPDAPPSVTGYTRIPECNYKNNWTLNVDAYQPTFPMVGVTCNSAVCATSLGKVDSHPVHLTIEAESTLSAVWPSIRQGIVNFNGTGSNATYVAVGAFPDNLLTPCTCTTGCMKTAPGVNNGMVQLTQTSSSALSTALPALSLNFLQTPYLTAYDRAIAYAINDKATFPYPISFNEAVVLVLASDPTSALHCGPSTNSNILGAMVDKAQNAYATKGIRTFVIAAPAAASIPLRNAASAIAAAGRGRSYYVPFTTASALTANVAASLIDIQKFANEACTYYLPDPSLFDASTSTILYNTTATGLTSVNNIQPTATQVSNAAAIGQNYLDACLSACSSGEGYCYDDYLPPAGAPTRIVYCPTTCGKIAAEPFTTAMAAPTHGFASFTLGCPTAFVGGQGPPLNPYHAKCVGAPENGQKPLWTFLAYDATTPSDASGTLNVHFDVQTAPELSNGLCPTSASAYSPLKTAAVARLYTGLPAYNTQNCPMNGSVPNCPIDLVRVLNGGMLTDAGVPTDGATPSGVSINGPALADCLSLGVTLNTNANGTLAPTLNNFELRYSCVSAE